MNPEELKTLIEKFFNDSISAEEKADMESALNESEEARALFREMANFETSLRFWAKEFELEKKVSESSSRVEHAFPMRIFRVGTSVLGIAAALLLCVGGILYFTHPKSSASLARITFSSQDIWDDDYSVPKRQHLNPGTYHLRSGYTRFVTNTGAVVSMSGPARFTMIDDTNIAVDYGKLTARLGFDEADLNIVTKSMHVKDLGTAFGLQVESEGTTSVSVFEGEVEVGKEDQPQDFRNITEGNTIISGGSYQFTDEFASITPETFNDLWPLTLGIDRYSNLVNFLPPGPLNKPMHQTQSSSEVFVVQEKQGYVLETPLSVEISKGGEVWPDDINPVQIPAGVRVNSFVLFFNPDKNNDQWLHRVSGEIRFENEILGVICSHRKLLESDNVFALNSWYYLNPFDNKRGLESEDIVDFGYYILSHDIISLSEDRRQLYFNFSVTTSIDDIRVIVKN